MEEVLETSQYLSFTLGGELFALDIAKVREVLDYTRITHVPRMPDFILGVINLRGSVVPVVDMRLKFDMAKVDNTVNTCIVIVEVLLEGETIALGALVDAVQEVFNMEPSQIELPPRIGTKLKTEFIKGMGKKDDQFVIILDIDRIFSMEELSLTDIEDRDI
ncbi:MAG: chemotaxis protein CheW [Candidatus Eremiobacterota bacterium]